MNKKIKVITTILIMGLSFSACGKNDKSEGPGTTQSTLSESGKVDSSEKNESDTVVSRLTGNFKVAGKNIYMKVPNYQQIECGFTRLFILNGERYVAVNYAKNDTASSLQQAHEIAFNQLKSGLDGFSDINSLTVEKDSTEVINGIEVYKFIGTLNCSIGLSSQGKSYEAYAIGYSFIMDGIPCSIVGSVINTDQKEEDIKEITEIVEEMITTVRDTE